MIQTDRFWKHSKRAILAIFLGGLAGWGVYLLLGDHPGFLNPPSARLVESGPRLISIEPLPDMSEAACLEPKGEEAPIRMIHGPRTQLHYTFQDAKLALDPVHGEIFVPQQDNILVFRREDQGDVAPVRILSGPDTRLGAGSVAIDPVNNLLIVSGSAGRGAGGQLLIFDRTAQGNAKPLGVISGPSTGLGGGGLRVYPPRGWILAFGQSGRGGGERASDNYYVGVWSTRDRGDVPPRWTIAGPQGMLRQPRGMAINAQDKTIIVSDKFLNAVMTYSFPEFFR